jgi:DNA processing protein
MAVARRGIVLTERQRLNWLRLIRSENVGPATFKELINHFGSAETAIDMLPDLSRQGGSARPIRVASMDEAMREMETATRFGATFIGIGEPDYPRMLRSIDGAPPLLAVKGTVRLTTGPAVAIVGSRNASIAWMRLTQRFAREIGAAGYTIISGLARGIDTAAHEASLATGTIAAMAGGLDKPYPPENLDLYQRITDGSGLAVSEMPFGWEPRARDFPRRNRLIAGIALGLLVMEAAQRSGSLISARRAADFGRLVFAVPGSPLDPRASGTNALIKDGATLTTEAADVLDMLAPLSPETARRQDAKRLDEEGPDTDVDTAGDGLATGTFAPLAEPGQNERAQIAAALGPVPVAIDDIVSLTGIAPQVVYFALLELDLAGRLERHPGGLVSLCSNI